MLLKDFELDVLVGFAFEVQVEVGELQLAVVLEEGAGLGASEQ